MKLNQVEIGQTVRVKIGKITRKVKVEGYLKGGCVSVILIDGKSNGKPKGYNGDFEVIS